ncbi:Demethylmenaquinone methyltransferase [Geodia barretti]|uniref:Demethylmenaquinone methyltransferase n=1 Tax=Geodia barretti TaxID=519541 RepID=A0AA35WC70_GEOBA|nr:Demethylmenaquinone methyltransferase [Geodia barretti]
MTDSHAVPLYDNIGVNYDATRQADPYLTARLAHHLGLKDQGQYLDIASGTGNYTTELAKLGGCWHGLDLSSGMLRLAGRKNSQICYLRGNSVALPFRDLSFDGAICTMALHHFARLLPVFCKANRVLRHGRLVIFTGTREQMAAYWLNEYFPIAMARSTAQMPTLESVLEALRDTGFSSVQAETYEVQPDLKDLFLYSGKHRPEIYLSDAVRRGISTFSTLADPEELESGCARLQQDIDSGKITEVAESFRHEGGDYVFVVASKERLG